MAATRLALTDASPSRVRLLSRVSVDGVPNVEAAHAMGRGILVLSASADAPLGTFA